MTKRKFILIFMSAAAFALIITNCQPEVDAGENPPQYGVSYA